MRFVLVPVEPRTLTCVLCQSPFPEGEPGSARFGDYDTEIPVCPECLQEDEPIVDVDHLIYQSKTLH